MKAETYFLSRLLGDKICSGNNSWICKPLPDWLTNGVLILSLGFIVYIYIKDKHKKVNINDE